MRIGIDLSSIDDSATRRSAELTYDRIVIESLVSLAAPHEFVLYIHERSSTRRLPVMPQVELISLPFRELGTSAKSPAERIAALVRSNPDRLDWLVLPDAMELGGALPQAEHATRGLKLATIVKSVGAVDAFVDPEAFQRILVPSQTVREALLARTGALDPRVFVIGMAADAPSLADPRPFPIPLTVQREFHRAGIRRSFLLTPSGPGHEGAARSAAAVFAALPDRFRKAYQLVIAGHPERGEAAEIRAICGADADLGTVVLCEADETLSRRLKQYALAYLDAGVDDGFPSGVLEAMHCGALVVTTERTSRAEILGDVGVRIGLGDHRAIAEPLAAVLERWAASRSLRDRVVLRARSLTGELAARRLLAALERAETTTTTVRRRVDRGHGSVPRVALVTPLPPRRSWITDAARELASRLEVSYPVELHDAPFGDTARDQARRASGGHSLAELDRETPEVDRRVILYQLGDSLAEHGAAYDLLPRRPGLVTLHDFGLTGLHLAKALKMSGGVEGFRRDLDGELPGQVPSAARLEEWAAEEGGLAAACRRRGAWFIRRILERSEAVVVPWHSWAERLRTRWPELAGRIHHIPQGMAPSQTSEQGRIDARRRLVLAPDDLVLSAWGFSGNEERVVDVLEAFREAVRVFSHLRLVAIDGGSDAWMIRKAARRLGVEPMVRVVDQTSPDAFRDARLAADTGVVLAGDPCRGESAAMLARWMSHGVPMILADAEAYSDFPASAVRRASLGAEGAKSLSRAIVELLSDAAARAELGRSSRRYIEENHSPERTLGAYRALIDGRLVARGQRTAAIPAPHHRTRWTESVL